MSLEWINLRLPKKRRLAFTLVELTFAIAIASLVAIALITTMVSSAKSIAALNNYVALDRGGRATLDQMVGDIRGCRKVTAVTPSGSYTNLSSITMRHQDSTVLNYTFDATAKTLVRTLDGTSQTLLTNCVGSFDLFQPILIPGSWNQYNNAAALRDCKVVQVKWTTRRSVLHRADTTEDIVTAKVLMRN